LAKAPSDLAEVSKSQPRDDLSTNRLMNHFSDLTRMPRSLCVLCEEYAPAQALPLGGAARHPNEHHVRARIALPTETAVSRALMGHQVLYHPCGNRAQGPVRRSSAFPWGRLAISGTGRYNTCNLSRRSL